MEDSQLFNLEKRFFQVFSKYEDLKKKENRFIELSTIMEYFDGKALLENIFYFVVCIPTLFIILWFQNFGITTFGVNASILILVAFVICLFISYMVSGLKETCVKKGLRTKLKKEEIKLIEKEYVEHYNDIQEIKLMVDFHVVTYYYIRLKTLMGEDNFDAFLNRLNPYHANIMKELKRRENLSKNNQLYEKHRLLFEKAETDGNIRIEDAPEDFWLNVNVFER